MTRIPTHLPKSDPPLREARVAGARLTFTDEGNPSGIVLLAVHGVPGSVRDFRYLGPPLSTFARFIRVDLPGSGGSEPRREALRSLEVRAETVLGLADQLEIARFGIIGHSMGAGTALVTASMAPGRLSHLVLIAPMGLRPHRGLSRSRGSFMRIAFMLRVPGLRSLILPSVRSHYKKRRFPRADEMTVDEYATHFESFTAADYPLLNRAARKPLPQKTLIAFAADDHLVEPQIPTELAAAIPGAHALRFEDGGHSIQKHKASEIARAIRDL
ncbi:MAG: alpha/beta fold hydrolase [Vicinamibacteria bacterium]